MKLSYSIKALIRRDKIKADGTCPIYYFVRVAAVVTKIPSGKFILPGDWDDKNKCPKKTDQKLRNLGIILNKTVSGFETYMLSQEGMGRKVTLTVALNFFNQKSSVSLFLFWQEQMDLWKANKEHSTLKSYKSTLNVFRQFKPKADFGDLTPSLIDHFDNHMSVNRGNALGGRFTKHKCLKSIINQAIRKGYMTESPYRSFKIRAAEGKRMFLSIEEVKLIMALDVSGLARMAEHVKAMFLFSCFTGLRFSDVVSIKKENVILTDERPRIAFNVKKTDRAHIVPLAPKAIEIIKNQRPIKSGQDTVFPAYTNQAVNRELKDILKLAGINKHISFHCARHTFASNHVEADTSLIHLKDLLGHRNVSQTQIYARSIERDLFTSMNAVALKY